MEEQTAQRHCLAGAAVLSPYHPAAMTCGRDHSVSLPSGHAVDGAHVACGSGGCS